MGVAMTRRVFAAFAAGAADAMLSHASLCQDRATELIGKAIPRSGERIPAVGLGTAAVFDTADTTTRNKAADVIAALIAGDGRLIDTASTYGDAERIIGDVVATAGLRDKLFIATKLESPSADELKRSRARLKTDKLDLLQLHNVRNPKQSLARFKEWQKEGICRFVGITSTFHGDFAAVESVLRRETPDFLQIDYSLDDRIAEKRLLPAAAEVNAAVMTALPFGRGRLFRAVRGKELPEWAKEFDATSWAQFFLKFLLGDARVTAVIPGTADARHMADNLGAARGRLPDAEMRKRMVAFLDTL
jgi:aryl-alcohol dehydrogenase-like predicted oxidoreductase